MMNFQSSITPFLKTRRPKEFDLERLMNELLGPSQHFSNEFINFTPRIDIRETPQSYFVDAELPGLKRDEIDITVYNDTLFLKGEKKTFFNENKKDYHHIERSYGSFYRSIPLASDSDIEKINASMNEGVLTIEIPKTDLETTQKRTINIG